MELQVRIELTNNGFLIQLHVSYSIGNYVVVNNDNKNKERSMKILREKNASNS